MEYRTDKNQARALLRSGVQLLKLSVPIAGVQLAQVALTTIDLVMMGFISVQAIAVGGLVVSLYNLLRTMCVGMMTVVGNMVSTVIGQSEAAQSGKILDSDTRLKVSNILRAAFLVGIITAVLLAMVFIALGYSMTFFGYDDKFIALAQFMIMALAPGLVPMTCLYVLRQFAVGMHRPGSLLVVTIASIGINIVLNCIFIYGLFDVPKLGLAGIGLATACVQFISLFTYYFLLRRDSYLSSLIPLDWWKVDMKIAGSMVRTGIPISATYGLEAGIAAISAVLMGHFGPIILAAHNIVIQLTRIAFQISIGISNGASILISYIKGRGSAWEVKRMAIVALGLGFIVTSLLGLAYIIASDPILHIFLKHNNAAVMFLPEPSYY